MNMPEGHRPCKRCGEEIFFAETPDGKQMPLDFRKSTTYRIADDGKLLTDDEGKIVSCHGHMSHWATCPHARDFKRKQAN